MAIVRRFQPKRIEDLLDAVDFAVPQQIQFMAQAVQLGTYHLLRTTLVPLPVLFVLFQFSLLPLHQLNVLPFGGLVLLQQGLLLSELAGDYLTSSSRNYIRCRSVALRISTSFRHFSASLYLFLALRQYWSRRTCRSSSLPSFSWSSLIHDSYAFTSMLR